eukprot:jgi/Botrbrau1/21344/Bobra.0184s0054.1
MLAMQTTTTRRYGVGVKYNQIPQEEEDEYANEVFNDPRLDEVPLQAVGLAVLLLALGILFLGLSYLHAAGHVEGHDHGHIGFLVLGILTFLPGFYTTRIAYYTWRGRPGYSYRAIPT